MLRKVTSESRMDFRSTTAAASASRRSERSKVFATSRVPPGIDVSTLELWEDDRRLGPNRALHDDIRKLGGGRYNVGGRWLYFSTSDGSDGRRNDRTYLLKPRTSVPT